MLFNCGPLNFRASLVHSVEYVVDDYSFEEGNKGNSDEGLDIVSSLEKKGITKLFPIQVPFNCFHNFGYFCAIHLTDVLL